MREKIKIWLWRWTLKKLRLIVDAADDRIHTEEIKLRDRLAPPAPAGRSIEFDRVASGVRERARRRESKPKTPRLRYQAGQWVRQ